ncbi:MAG: bile acid:sodium symporter family protein, partial [Cytophagaceae bacterium]
MNKLPLLIAALAFAALLIGLLIQQPTIWQPAAVLAAVSFAFGMQAIQALKTYQYTAWIIVVVVAGMIYPGAFTHWGTFDLRNKWLILVIIQLVMFGMGIQMSIRDFSGLATTGKGVAIGLLCHFSVMPLMGLLLTRVFHFEPEIAAGIILIGSCSSGLASNVMVYLAKANLVLSVVVTAMATLAAPFLTPLLLKLLAGTLIEIKFVNMMMEIIKIVIVPIFAALLHDYLKSASATGIRTVQVVVSLSTVWLAVLALGGWPYIEANVPSPELRQFIEIVSFLLGAMVIGFGYHQLATRNPKLD